MTDCYFDLSNLEAELAKCNEQEHDNLAVEVESLKLQLKEHRKKNNIQMWRLQCAQSQ